MVGDSCETATLIEGTYPFVDSGSTSQASQVPEGSSATTCNLILNSTKAVWYKLEGDDSCYTASTEGSPINTILAIYKASNGC